MTVNFSRDVMIGMLRKGNTGDEILQILNVIVPDTEQDSEDEYVDYAEPEAPALYADDWETEMDPEFATM